MPLSFAVIEGKTLRAVVAVCEFVFTDKLLGLIRAFEWECDEYRACIWKTFVRGEVLGAGFWDVIVSAKNLCLKGKNLSSWCTQ